MSTNQNGPQKRYAVIFRTHFWDAFAERQLERLRKSVLHGDIYVLVDETNGPSPNIAHDKIFRMKEKDALELGLAKAGSGNLLWYNGDYPLYLFRRAHDDYDFYLQLEFDAVLNFDVDAFIARLAERGADFVALTKGEAPLDWPWLRTCSEVYRPEDVRFKLICVSIYSNKALRHLERRRLSLSADYQMGKISSWPFCEGFLATEVTKSDLVDVDLGEFFDMTAYDHWPPYVEDDLQNMRSAPVIHPVLDRKRYIDSMLKYPTGIKSYFMVWGGFHKKLRRLPLPTYVKVVTSSFFRKVTRNLEIRTRSTG